jgi:hypothetical protein
VSSGERTPPRRRERNRMLSRWYVLLVFVVLVLILLVGFVGC